MLNIHTCTRKTPDKNITLDICGTWHVVKSEQSPLLMLSSSLKKQKQMTKPLSVDIQVTLSFPVFILQRISTVS